jgi:hypothetical protein
MTPITVSTADLPKYLFASEDRIEAVVVTLSDVLEAGTPLVSDGDHEGDEMGLVGRVDDSVPVGPVDLSAYSLPSKEVAGTAGAAVDMADQQAVDDVPLGDPDAASLAWQWGYDTLYGDARAVGAAIASALADRLDDHEQTVTGPDGTPHALVIRVQVVPA